MRISYGKFIRNTVIENLISSHERITKEGNAAEIVHITKFILKTSKKFDNELLDLCFEKNEQGSNAPPSFNYIF